MKKLVIVIPPKHVLEPELLNCLTVWKGKLTTLTVSTYPNHPLGHQDYEAVSSLQLENISPAAFDGIVVMGGTGTKEYLWDYAPLIERLQIFDSCKRLVAGIGLGSLVLAQAGLLIGKRATTSASTDLIEILEGYGAIYSARDTVRIGWIVTSNGSDAYAFANAVLDLA